MSRQVQFNILHIGKYFPPFHGGIENVTADLLEQQNRSGMNASAIVHQHEKGVSYVEECSPYGKVKRVPILGQAVFVPIAPAFTKYLSKALTGTDKPDVVHMHMPNVSCFWTLFSRKARKSVWVIHWHSDVLGAAPDWRVKLLYPVYRIFERALLKKAKAIIVTSPGYLESSEPLQAFRDKCYVIPLGISIEPLKQDKTFILSPGRVLKILCIGRLTYYKGHRFLLEAIARLSHSSLSIELTIVGKGELESSLKRMVRSNGLEETVNFVGGVTDDELDNLMQETDLLCLPSIERTEAFGVVLLEAMRAGKPCLVTDVPGSGMNWVVQDGRTGFVVKAGDANAIAEALSYASEHKKTLKEMGEAGRKRFEEHFTIDKVAAQIEDLYKEILSKN